MTPKQKAYIALGITSIVWGTTWVVMKLGVNKMPALQLAAIRQLTGGLLFLIYFLFIKKAAIPTNKQLLQIFTLSIFTFVFANGFSTWSLKYIPSGLGALIGALYPLCIVLMEYFFYNNKKLHWLTILGILIGLLGISVVFYENAMGTHAKNYFFGVTLSLIAMASWSYSTIKITRDKINVNPYFGVGLQMLFGCVMMFILAYSSGNFIAINDIPVSSWLAIAYLTVAGSIIAFVAFIYSMKYLPTSIASLYAYINPIIATAIGTVVLNEKVTFNLIVGSIITLLGVFLVNYSNKKLSKKI